MPPEVILPRLPLWLLPLCHGRFGLGNLLLQCPIPEFEVRLVGRWHRPEQNSVEHGTCTLGAVFIREREAEENVA